MKKNTITKPIILCALLVMVPWFSARAQESHETKDSIVLAHQFMRALYPDLNESRTFTVQTYFPYGQLGSSITRLEVSIGDGPKDAILRYAGGCMNEPPLPAAPSAMLSSADAAKASGNASSAISGEKQRTDCLQGPLKTKQFLVGVFWFDHLGHISAYAVETPRELDRMNSLASFVLSHPDMSDTEVALELKKAGVKYGPMDKQEFTKHLSLTSLEPFMGNLKILSVEFSPLLPNRNNIATWPDWRVRVEANGPGKTNQFYELMFDQFRGDLISLRIAQPGDAKP